MGRLTAISIEDDPLWANVITLAINELQCVNFIGSTLNGRDGLSLCNEMSPDVVLMDLGLPDYDGFESAARLRATNKPPRIVFLTVRSDDLTLFRAWNGPIEGLVWKTLRCREDLRATFAALSAGRRYFPSDVFEAVNRFRSSPTAFFKILSSHEQTLVEAFVRGDSNAQIGSEMGLSHHTIQSHRKRIMAKLNLHSTRELIRWGTARGFSMNPAGGLRIAG